MMPGILPAVFGGFAGPSKKAPSLFFFSSVSGGKISGSAGSPRKRSGMKTWYCWAESAWARISAPCLACELRPKMSYTMRMAEVAEAGPVASSKIHQWFNARR